MKIGIITFHDTTNFGATLQAVATYKALCNYCSDVEILDYRCTNIDKREVPQKYYDFRKFKLKGFILFIFLNRKRRKRYKTLHKFLQAETKVSKRYTKDSIHDAVALYDVFLVGSDMLWCLKITDYDYTYMLDFVKDGKKKYAFATSMGYKLEESDYSDVKKYLEDFTFIAVREQGLADTLGHLLNRNISRVCDPTMLIKADIWKEYVYPINRGSYALVYMDTSSKICLKDSLDYAKKYKVNVLKAGFRLPIIYYKGYEFMELYSIEDFLSAIANAAILYTASYHGMLFALYFHIPFVYYNKDASRLQELAELMGVEYRNGDKYHHLEMKEIDWPAVDKQIENVRKHSIDILDGMVKKHDNL